MKRLVFCFDGTWNKLEPGRATNVVLTDQIPLENALEAFDIVAKGEAIKVTVEP